MPMEDMEESYEMHLKAIAETIQGRNLRCRDESFDKFWDGFTEIPTFNFQKYDTDDG